MNNSYWMYDWLDNYAVRTTDQAARILSIPSAVDDLRQMAVNAAQDSSQPASEQTSIVAGRGIDLSGHLDCDAYSSRQRQIDQLFRKAWHYFDRIIVADAVSHEVSAHWESVPKRTEWVLSHIAVLLALRDAGAQDLIEFREKPLPCELHWRKHAEDAGLQKVLTAADSFIPILARESKIDLEVDAAESLSFSLTHLNIEHTVWGDLSFQEHSGKTTAQIREAVAEAVVRRYVAHLTSDIIAARDATLPLGTTIWLHGELMRSSSGKISAEEVAFNLELPILEGMPIGTLMKIRRDEHESFQRFRGALRLAVKESGQIHESTGAFELSNQIRLDIIEPELRHIRDRLAAAERTLSRKTAVGIFLGALVTTCGILAGVPDSASVAAGVAAMAATEATAASKYLEEQSDTSLSNMYFLWKAVEHKSHEL